MKSFSAALIAGACSLGVGAMVPAAQAAPQGKSGGNSVAGISMKDIQEVGRGGGGGGRGGGWGGGGRSYGGAKSFGGGRSFGGRGWGGRGNGLSGYRGGGYRGGGYRGYRGGYGYRGYRGSRYGYGWRGRGYRYGGYYAAGLIGAAALASPYYYDDHYGYDYAPRRAYYGSECQIISKRRTASGRPIKVVRYRPC